MNELHLVSEVTLLRQQIRAEYEAAQLGLYGLAEGTARHAFITRKMENMAGCCARLKQLVGENEAAKILVETLETSN
jgi:hypothetical protein